MTRLKELCEQFAQDVAETVSAFVGRDVRFSSLSRDQRFVISDDGAGVAIPVGSGAHLSLEISYHCELDSHERFLRVHKSKVGVHPGRRIKGDPLFRYECDTALNAESPVSHLHIHAHRDQFTRVMTLAAVAGHKRRRTPPDAELEAARMSKVHFPTGGLRFRPTLEDVLQMIEREFGVKTGPGWRDVLHRQRLRWRRQQTAAAARDCPSAAVQALKDLGYTVAPPDSGPLPDNEARLTAF